MWRDTDLGLAGVEVITSRADIAASDVQGLVSYARMLMIGRQQQMNHLHRDVYDDVRRDKWLLEDGTIIEALSIGGSNRLIIDLTGAEAPQPIEIVTRVIYFPSGLMSVYSRPQKIAEAHFAFPLEAWQVGEIVPVEEGGAPRTYDVNYDDWVQANITTPTFSFFSNDNDKIVRYVHNRIPSAADSGSLNTYTPQEYTGAMVQYQQMRMSQGYSNVFSPTWGTTHGLWSWSGTVNNLPVTRWWVIELSASNGIRAWPINFLDPATINAAAEQLFSENPDAIYSPEPTITDGYEFFLEELFTYPEEDLIEVAPPTLLADAHEGAPIYAEAQGWKFSPDGHKACVVTRQQRDFSGTSIYWMQRWELTISGADEGPTSASIELLAEDWMYLGSADINVRAPVSRLLGVNSITSFATVPPGGTKPTTGDPPFYSWYKPDGNRIDFDYHFSSSAAGIDIIEGRSLETGPQVAAPCNAPTTLITLAGSLGVYRRFSHSGFTNNYFSCSDATLGFGDGVVVTSANLILSDAYGIENILTSEVSLGSCSGVAYFAQETDKYILSTQQIITAYTSNAAMSVMIPLNHAQGLFVYSGKRESVNAHTKTFNKKSGAFGWSAPYIKPPGYDGSGTSDTDRGVDIIVSGNGFTDSSESIPASDEYTETYQAFLFGEAVDLEVPGYLAVSNQLTNPVIFTTHYANNEGFEPERYMLSTHGSPQLNETGFDDPNEGGLQLITAFFGNLADPKPWDV